MEIPGDVRIYEWNCQVLYRQILTSKKLNFIKNGIDKEVVFLKRDKVIKAQEISRT
jgi:hypothetical protein